MLGRGRDCALRVRGCDEAGFSGGDVDYLFSWMDGWVDGCTCACACTRVLVEGDGMAAVVRREHGRLGGGEGGTVKERKGK